MEERKGFFIKLGEFLDQISRRFIKGVKYQENPSRFYKLLMWLTPNGGTILIALLLILTQQVWADQSNAIVSSPGPSANTVNYQGRLADSGGTPQNGTFSMTFSLWDAATGGNLIWGPETHPSVPVSSGLFSVGLGAQTSGGIPVNVWDGDRFLQITVGGETLTPREIIRSVPLAGLALNSLYAEDAADSLHADSADSIPVQHIQDSLGGWTPLRNANSFITEFDNPITITHRSVILLAYSGTFACTGGSGDCYFKFYRNATRLLDGPYVFTNSGTHQPFSAQVIDVVEPGTYTYRLYIESLQSTTQYRVFGSTFSILVIPTE